MPRNAPQYDRMRMLNCKSFEVQNYESYPQIRPPISRCYEKQTAEWLAKDMADKGCDRLADLDMNGAMKIWKDIPRKESLSYYGIESEKDKQKPEALEYKKVVSRCLLRVTEKKEQIPITKKKPQPRSTKKLQGYNVLDRELLMNMVSEMPNIQNMLSPSNVPFCIKERFRMDSERTPKSTEKFGLPHAGFNQQNYEKVFKKLMRCFD